MNGYVKSTWVYRRIANLIEQIPQSRRLSIAQDCLPSNGNIHDWERILTGICLRKTWEETDPRNDLGTHAIISGGEVLELDAHLEAQYDDQYDYPF